jgi:predicted permease
MDLGFRTDHLLLLSMDVGDQGYDEAKGQQFYKELLDRVAAIYGVRSASLARFVPLGYQNDLQDVFREDQVATSEERQSFFYNVVGRNYFESIGVPLLRGRDFTEQDNESAPKVAIVNEAFAAKLWPGQDPLDKRLKMGREGAYFKVVGVTKNASYIAVGADAEPFFYLPLSQNYRSTITLYVQTAGVPSGLLVPVQRTIQGLDPELPVFDVKTMASHIRDGRALLFVRLGAMLSMAFGLLGLILSAIGIYGVISHSVTQRTHEIGLRMALGATPYNVLKLVIGKGMILIVSGLVFGLGMALVIARLLSGLLYGVGAADPLTFAVIATVLLAVGLLACFLPARRAIKLDPMEALRSE